MADEKITDLSLLTTPDNLDLSEIVSDPAGTPASKAIELWVKRGRWVGTSFPGSPATGTVCYRTDRHIEYYYDGTRWLTTQLFVMLLPSPSVAVITADTAYRIPIPYQGVYSLFLERLDVAMYRTAAGEWDVAFNYEDVTGAGTALITPIDGNGTTTNNWTPHSATIAAPLSASARILAIFFDEISGTSSLFAVANLSFRLVG